MRRLLYAGIYGRRMTRTTPGRTYIMNNSLQQRLSVWLSAAIVAMGFLAAGFSFRFAYEEAQEFQDSSLRQIASLVDASRLPLHRQRSIVSTDNEPDERIIFQRLSAIDQLNPERVAVPADLTVGFHTIDIGATRWRLYVRALKSGEHIVVGQATQMRDEAARDSALRTLLPLLGLIPLLVLLARRLVSASLAPVRALAQVVDAQPEDRPAPLSTTQVPDEIAPFVQSINQLLERINRLMGQQRRFIADAAHELRSPLTALSVQAQNLRHADSLETARERIVPLLAGIERAQHLTEQLLSLARTQAGSSNDVDVNLSAMARELIAQYLPLAEARGIDLGLEEMAQLSVRAASENLWLIVKNALENALKYSPEGGETTIRLSAQEDDAVIEIIDNGPGIPTPDLVRVFDPFYRIPGTAGEGNGLGLCIAQEAAMRLGGVVSLHARPHGNGLIFRYRQKRQR